MSRHSVSFDKTGKNHTRDLYFNVIWSIFSGKYSRGPNGKINMNLNKSCFPAWAAVLLLLCSTPFVTSGIAPEKKTRILLVAQHDPTYRLPSDVAYSVIDALDPERTGLPAEINAIWITQHQSDSAVRAALEQLARELQDGRCDLIISRHPLTHPILEFLKARKLDIPVVFYDAPEQEQGLQQEYPNSTGLIRYRDAAETALTAAALFPSCFRPKFCHGHNYPIRADVCTLLL